MPKLTKRIIDAVKPQATEFFLWDEGMRFEAVVAIRAALAYC